MPCGYLGLKIFTSLSLRFHDFQRSHVCSDTGTYKSELDHVDYYGLTMVDAKTSEVVLKVVCGSETIDYRALELNL